MTMVYDAFELETKPDRWRIWGKSDDGKSELVELCLCEDGHESKKAARKCPVASAELERLFPGKKKKVVNLNIVSLKLIAARAAHEANRAYSKHLGDDSQLPWAEAPGWQQASAFMGVGVIIENPQITPAQQHSMWMAHKKNEGWVYGEKKDEEAKTHPCMVRYDQLPPEQRFKDALFGATTRAVLGITL